MFLIRKKETSEKIGPVKDFKSKQTHLVRERLKSIDKVAAFITTLRLL